MCFWGGHNKVRLDIGTDKCTHTAGTDTRLAEYQKSPQRFVPFYASREVHLNSNHLPPVTVLSEQDFRAIRKIAPKSYI